MTAIPPFVALTLAAVLIGVGAAVGVRRSRQSGRVDPFHPLLFPSLYAGFVCLVPTAWLMREGTLSTFEADALAPGTSTIMALAVVGFSLGCALPLRPRRILPSDRGPAPSLRPLEQVARPLFLIPVAYAFHGFVSKTVLTRAHGQNSFTIIDHLASLTSIVAVASLILLLTARRQQGKTMLSPLDWWLVGGFVAFTALNGDRSPALSTMLILLIFFSRGRASVLSTAIALPLMVAFALAVVNYRVEAVGLTNDTPRVEAVVADLGSVMFTTGLVAVLMGQGPYLDGSTIVDALLRQLPGPLSNWLFGPPKNTGAFRFRSLSGLDSDSMGYSFSLPAEGFINFGTPGVVLLMFIAGALMAWAYSRFDPAASRMTQSLYVVVTATLPYWLRSDMLTALKITLYPALVIAIAFNLAAAVERSRTRTGGRNDRLRTRAIGSAGGSAQIVRRTVAREDTVPHRFRPVTGRVPTSGGGRHELPDR